MGFENKLVTGISILALILGLIAITGTGTIKGNESNAEELSVFDKILSEKKITACYINYPPFNILDPATGKVSGAYVEAFELIMKKLGVTQINYIESTWAHIAIDLSSKRCEINVSGIFPLIERTQGQIFFTRSLGYLGNNGVVRKEDNRFSSIEQLNNSNVRIAVIDGEASHEYAKANLAQAQLRVISASDFGLAFQEVLSGTVDVALGDDWEVTQYVRVHPELKKLLIQGYLKRSLTFAVRNNDPQWLNFLDNAINVIVTSGELDTLYAKYDLDIEKPSR
ncbi:MAG: transporter substrate-binding domain-containing protein [Candidatus Diapherotrites archaeon]|nr:transporter substrate-binding domain-containing protein [Candidatus Diapherotrites archaeon]